MCFWKSKQSKVLRAKRDIVVYKIGDFADKDTFVPYYMNSFTYKTNVSYRICPDFKSNAITIGFHGYINILVTVDNPSGLNAIVQKNDKYRLAIAIYGTFQYTLYLGRFIVPKGSEYYINSRGEIVSSNIIYTSKWVKL